MDQTGKRTLSFQTAGAIILFFFFCSGALGLIYEIVWTRLLRHVMGNTVYSITTVLSVFMAGLALGSFLGGKLIDRRGHPLQVYGILEGAIGIYCLLLPALLGFAGPLYRLLYRNFSQSYYLLTLFRFLFSALLLLLPATLMGATFPVLSKFFVRNSSRIGRIVGNLYAVNTFGAVLGSFATGFIFIPLAGVSRTLHAAAAGNLLIGFGVLLLYRFRPLRMEAETAGEAAAPGAVVAATDGWVSPGIIVFCYAASGFAALVYEIAWTRALALVIGSSVYAFCLMLTAFISGLALGSLIFSRLFHRWKNLVLVFAFFELAIGFSALLVVPVFGRLPLFMAGLLLRFSFSFWTLQAVEFGLIFLLLLVPTVLMGGAFPLAARLYVRDAAKIGGAVGGVYAANTLGSILGSFAGGFILLPWLGLQKTIMAAVLVNVGIGIWFLFLNPAGAGTRKRILAGAITAVVVVLAVALPAWDKTIMISGVFLYADQLAKSARNENSSLERKIRERRILFYKDDASETIAVTEDSRGGRAFRINGKVDGSNAATDMLTQELLAHVPMLLHPDPRKVLVIGLGTGVTLGSAGRYPAERLDCVDISPSARKVGSYFEDVNYRVLSDPRAELTIADGRNFLSLSGRTYDVITSEPSNPWVAGVADLFTREFFELCRRRLNPGGVACVWLHAYDMDDGDFRSIVRTFHDVFPHVLIWESLFGRDYLITGSAENFTVDYTTLRHRLESEPVASDLRRIGLDDPVRFLGCFMLGGAAIDEYARGARIHTDDNARLEFSAPRSLFKRGVDAAFLEGINPYRGRGLEFLVWEGVAESEREGLKLQLADFIKATGCILDGEIGLMRKRYDRALRAFGEAAACYPRDLSWVKRYLNFLLDLSVARLKAGAAEEALAIGLDLLKLSPDDPRVHTNLALAYGVTGEDEKAIAEARTAITLDPKFAVGHHNLAMIYLGSGKFDDAVAECRAALLLQPDWPDPHYTMGMAYLRQEKQESALAELLAFVKARPDFAPAREEIANIYETRGDASTAAKYRQQFKK